MTPTWTNEESVKPAVRRSKCPNTNKEVRGVHGRHKATGMKYNLCGIMVRS